MNLKLRHLKRLDEKILRLWIEADGNLNADQGDAFLGLLERRIQLLRALREAGEKLHPTLCVPPWLERFSRGMKYFSLRDLKMALEQTQRDLDSSTS